MDKFANAKVGDKVFSFIHGEGTIRKVGAVILTIDFNTGAKGLEYYSSGKYNSTDKEITLYWNKPVFDDPEPKRKIKKTITKWTNLYTDSNRNWTTGYNSKEEAIELSKKTFSYIKALVVAQPVVFEWEEEE